MSSENLLLIISFQFMLVLLTRFEIHQNVRDNTSVKRKIEMRLLTITSHEILTFVCCLPSFMLTKKSNNSNNSEEIASSVFQLLFIDFVSLIGKCFL